MKLNKKTLAERITKKGLFHVVSHSIVKGCIYTYIYIYINCKYTYPWPKDQKERVVSYSLIYINIYIYICMYVYMPGHANAFDTGERTYSYKWVSLTYICFHTNMFIVHTYDI